MVEIAKHSANGGVLQKEISANQDISLKYLDPIINSLKVANLIHKKSHKKGFILTKSADEIQIYDIYKAFEVDILNVTCLDQSEHCVHDITCEVRGFWCELNNTIAEKFKSVTLQQIIDRNT
jgi:Rrf2 family protein